MILGMTLQMWLIWAVLLIGQNFAFTFVSRARSSGSLRRHLIAGIFSNGVWFASQIFAVGAFMSIITGKFGLAASLFAGVFYTTLTLTGSVLAHYYALRSEKGSSRVGAHKDVASFTKAEGDLIRNRMLLIDTGDGKGTFTIAELIYLKELAGTTVETVEELVTESLPPTYNSLGAQTPAWQPKDITAIPPACPGQGAKL